MKFNRPLLTIAVALLGLSAAQSVIGDDRALSRCSSYTARCANVDHTQRSYGVRERVRTLVSAAQGDAFARRYDFATDNTPITPHTLDFQRPPNWLGSARAVRSTRSLYDAYAVADVWLGRGLIGADVLIGDQLRLGAALSRAAQDDPPWIEDAQIVGGGLNTNGLSGPVE